MIYLNMSFYFWYTDFSQNIGILFFLIFNLKDISYLYFMYQAYIKHIKPIVVNLQITSHIRIRRIICVYLPDYPFTDPIIIPLTKYFCAKG